MIAWGLAWVGLSYRVEVRNSIVETQLQIDKNLEAALVSEGKKCLSISPGSQKAYHV